MNIHRHSSRARFLFEISGSSMEASIVRLWGREAILKNRGRLRKFCVR